MPGFLAYEFRMTPEFARTAVAPLEQVLWLQNERLYQHLDSRMRYRSILRSTGIVLSALGLALALVGFCLTCRRTMFFAGISAVFLLLLLAFVYLPSMAGALRRNARRMVARRARKTMSRIAARAPYTISYELRDGVLTARVERVAKTLNLRAVKLAVATPDFIGAFRRPLAQSPFRLLYTPGSSERAALCEALTAAGAQILNLGVDAPLGRG